jgi:hypothetical protein
MAHKPTKLHDKHDDDCDALPDPASSQVVARPSSKSGSRVEDGVTVSIISLTGDTIATLELPSSASVWTVKEQLMPVCNLKPEQQQLLQLYQACPTEKDPHPLHNNKHLSELAKPLELQLIKSTVSKGVWHVHVRGMWSLSGKRCELVASPDMTLDALKSLIQRDTGVLKESQELQPLDTSTCSSHLVKDMLPSEDEWSHASLRDVLLQFHYSPRQMEGLDEQKMPLSLLLFARAHPDRAGLLKKMQNGEISAAAMLALDPDSLMPAC